MNKLTWETPQLMKYERDSIAILGSKTNSGVEVIGGNTGPS